MDLPASLVRRRSAQPLRRQATGHDPGRRRGSACALRAADARFLVVVHRDRTDTGPVLAYEVTLRSVEMFTEYEPGSCISFISPTPLLLVVALADHLTVADEALAAYQRALEPKKLVMLSGGHFDAYVKDFEQASTPARDWFVTHLKNR